MNITDLKRPPSSRHLTVFVLVLEVSLVAAYALPGAQAPAKKAMAIDDYTKWRSIERQAISGDGKWIVYTLQTTNVAAAEAKPVLHLLNLENGVDVTVTDATDGTFSPDSQWMACQVDPGAAQRGRGGRGGSGAVAPANAGQSQTAPSAQGGAPSGQGGRGGAAARPNRRRVGLAAAERGTPPVARQRGRHRVQPHGRAARLHRGRGREGRQRPLRLRHAHRAGDRRGGRRGRVEHLG